MSWFSGITEKAEGFLNKLDQSAADAFHADQHDRGSPVPSAITADRYHPRDMHSYNQPLATQPYTSLTPSVSVPANLNKLKNSGVNPSSSLVSSPVQPSLVLKTGVPQSPIKHAGVQDAKASDDALFEFLNSSGSVDATKRTVVTPVSSTRHSRQSSTSSTVSNKSGKFVDVARYEQQDLLDGGMSVSMTSEASDVGIMIDAPGNIIPVSTAGVPGDISALSEHSQEQQLSTLELENKLLKNEISSLNQEMAGVIKRAREAEEELAKCSHRFEQYTGTASQNDQRIRELQARENDLMEAMMAKDAQLAVLRVRLEEADHHVQTHVRAIDNLKGENSRIRKDHTDSSGVSGQALGTLKDKLAEVQGSLLREQDAYKKVQQEGSERLSKLETEQQKLATALTAAQRKLTDEKSRNSDYYSQLQSVKSSLGSARQELSDYKDKAARILQSKERLIASLREGSGASGEAVGVSNLEYDAVKQERDIFKEEIQQNKMMIDTLKTELQDIESLMQRDNEIAQDQVQSLEDILSEEKLHTEDAEQELLKQKQELQFSLEELHRQKLAMQGHIEERDAEVERLRNQLMTKSISSTSENELEGRVRTLTESLIQKQTYLEALSTEKNSLFLQLERMEQQYRDVQKVTRNRPGVTMISVNDDEDALRQRLPLFLKEGPSDHAMTKKMKRAAGVIDKFSLKMGLFLRRYPAARLFVILYMGLLHFWVMIVLLTYKPEIHGSEYQPHAPSGGQ